MKSGQRERLVTWAFLALLGAAGASADTVLWNNGPLINAPFGGPGGAHASTVQANLGLTKFGFGSAWAHGASQTHTEFSDDFVVATPGGWHVTSVAIQGLSTSTAVTVKVLDGPPWAGGTVLAQGLAGWTCSGSFRVGAAAASREICTWELPFDLQLGVGSYWLQWKFGGSILFEFQPPVTIAGAVNTGDARMEHVQCVLLECTSSGWQPIVDVGPQGLPFTVRGRPASAIKGNFDGAASPEIVLRNVNPQSPEYGRHKLWLMNGSTRVGETFLTPDTAGPSWALVAADDFDTAGAPYNGPDGRTDVVFQDTATGELEVWLLQGETRVGAARPVSGAPVPGPSWTVAAAADFNRDARPDLLWKDLGSQQLLVWTLDGTEVMGSITPVPAQAQHPNWQVVAAQDFNGDGFVDLLWYNVSSGKVVLWYMNSSVARIAGAFTTPASAGNANWRVVASGDYSATGAGTPPLRTPDLLWRNLDSARLVLWHLDFTGTRVLGEFTSPASEPAALDWQVVGPR